MLARKEDVVILNCKHCHSNPNAALTRAGVEFHPRSATEEARIVISPRSGWAPEPPCIAFRTLPRYDATHDDYVYRAGPRGAEQKGERGPMKLQDRILRPDLSLARSDPGIRCVAEMAAWCAELYGGEGP